MLIVDDEPELREILKEILAPVASQILTAGNGSEALEIVKKQPVHAILCDVQMPVMSGFQFLAELRKMRLSTPFVIITGFGDRDRILEALRLDATDFLDKPFDHDQVIKVMKNAVELGLALEELGKKLDAILINKNISPEERVRLMDYEKSALQLRFFQPKK